MRGILTALIISLVSGVCGATQRYVPVVEQVIPSVVRINVVTATDNDVQSWIGSGVIVSTNGHILTCNHLVAGTTLVIDVRLYESSTTYRKAIVLRRDQKRDLALLKLVDYSTPTAAVRLAPYSPVVGEEVIAIGHPLALDWSVTTGVVSGLHRDGLAIDLVQTSAAINPGNSGGPLFNMDGEVLGLNESTIVGANNLGFAVSVDQIREFLAVFRGLDQVN